jgi:hypothetical protein
LKEGGVGRLTEGSVGSPWNSDPKLQESSRLGMRCYPKTTGRTKIKPQVSDPGNKLNREEERITEYDRTENIPVPFL